MERENALYVKNRMKAEIPHAARRITKSVVVVSPNTARSRTDVGVCV